MCQSRISGVRVEEIIWLDAVVEKLAVKHQVVPDEVEEVLYNKRKFRFVENIMGTIGSQMKFKF